VNGDPDGDQQQELLAPIAVAGDANGDDERWLKAQRLVSIRALWMKAQGYV